jgi:hypothetical protein
MNYNINIIVTGTEQIMRLDHFQALVHHGCTVQCNLGAHVPIRVCGSLGLDRARFLVAHAEEFLFGQVTKGATGSSEDNTTQASRWNAL